MFNALRNCGLVENEDKKDEYYPYEKFSDFRLPFGSCVGKTDNDVYTEFPRTIINSINYLRRTAELLTLEHFNELCPVLDKSNKTYKFLVNHLSNVRLVNEGTYHKSYNGIIGEHSSFDECEFVRDVEYGLSDVIFYVSFDFQYMKLIPHFDMSKFNYKYQSDVKFELVRKFGFSEYGRLNEEDALNAIGYLLDHSEFIPLKISTFDGVMVSHKAYRDKFGMRVDAVQSPALGLNIKGHDKIMKGLEGFISKGGRIFNNRLYLILESRDEKGTYYLRNYEKIKASDGDE